MNQGTLPDALLEIFAPLSDGNGRSTELELEKQIDRIVRDFFERPQVSSPANPEALAEEFKDSTIPEEGRGIDAYVEYLKEKIVEHSMQVSSPRFIGHMTHSLPVFTRPIAKLITALNQNTVKLETSNGLTFCERETLAALHRLFFNETNEFYATHVQNRDSTLGMMTSGGTTANIAALWCARNSKFRKTHDFPGIETAGLPSALRHFGFRGAAIIGSELMHYSIEKAVDILGLGTDHLIKIPTDQNFRVDCAKLSEKIEFMRKERIAVLAIVGIAGTTDSGSIDHLEELGGIARTHGIHFHVDAAWGGPVRFCEDWKHLLAGIERADSITVDGHKQLYVPMGSGMVLFRDPSLARSIEKSAAYVIRKDSLDLGRRSLEGSRPAMSLMVHAGLQLLGRRGYDQLIGNGLYKMRRMVAYLRQRSQFQLLHEPQTNIVLFRYLPPRFRDAAHAGTLSVQDTAAINAFNEELQRRQKARGETFVSRTTIPIRTARSQDPVPTVALRVVLSNPLSSEDDLYAVLRNQETIAEEMLTPVGTDS